MKTIIIHHGVRRATATENTSRAGCVTVSAMRAVTDVGLLILAPSGLVASGTPQV